MNEPVKEHKLQLREWRLSRALSQEELSSLAGIERATLARLEQGKQAPRPGTVRKIAKALEINPIDLFRDPFA